MNHIQRHSSTCREMPQLTSILANCTILYNKPANVDTHVYIYIVLIFSPYVISKHTSKRVLHTGNLVKSQKWHICKCIVCFDPEAKTKHESCGKQVCRKKKALGINICVHAWMCVCARASVCMCTFIRVYMLRTVMQTSKVPVLHLSIP
jgi:hypothetical protein